MPRFRYTIADENGRSQSGEMEAASAVAARAELESRGLRVERLEEIGTTNEAGAKWLSSGDFAEATGRLAETVRAGLPLGAGLRALGGELPSPRLRATFLRMSERVDRGEPLDRIVDDTPLPAHLRGLVRAGLQSGRLAESLERYLISAREAAERRRQLFVSLFYPLVVLLMSMTIVLFFLAWIVPMFRQIVEDFNTELPVMTRALFGLSWFVTGWAGLIALGVLLFVVSAVFVLLELSGGAALRRRCLCAVPLVGTVLRQAALARFCEVLSLLIDAGMPLSEALRAAGQACGDADLKNSADEGARAVESGAEPADSAPGRRSFPPALRQAFRFRGDPQAFSDGLRAAAGVFDMHARARTSLIGLFVEPAAVFGAAFCIGLLTIALFMPLIKLMNDLS